MDNKWSYSSTELVMRSEERFGDELVNLAARNKNAAARLLGQIKNACVDLPPHSSLLTSGGTDVELYLCPHWRTKRSEGCAAAICVTWDDDLIPVLMLDQANGANLEGLKRIAEAFKAQATEGRQK